ncbi:MAG: DinB family protein [Planctomycetota bacterium]
MTAPQHPLLAEYAQLQHQVIATVEEAFVPLTDSQRRFKPAPDRWSVAEVFDHLFVTGEKYLVAMEQALEKTRAQGQAGGDAAHRPTLMGRFLVRALGGKMKVKAPKAFAPAAAGADLHTLEEYLEEQQQLLDFMGRADGYSLSKVRYPSPAARLLRFNLGDGVRILVTHQQRHLQQARDVVNTSAFPRT